MSSTGVCALPFQAGSITEAPIGDPEGVTSPGLGVCRFRIRLIGCVAVQGTPPSSGGRANMAPGSEWPQCWLQTGYIADNYPAKKGGSWVWAVDR